MKLPFTPNLAYLSRKKNLGGSAKVGCSALLTVLSELEPALDEADGD